MASLKSLKIKIRGIKKTGQVTKAMEAVSAVKMRKSQEKAFAARPYAVYAASLLRRVASSGDFLLHPLAQKRAVKKTLFLVITSDKGLAGSLNASLLSLLRRTIEEGKMTKETLGFICIGRKGYEYLTRRGFTVVEYFDHVPDSPDASLYRNAARKALELFEAGAYDKVFVAYSNFISTLNQRPAIRTMLPFHREELEEIIKGVTPVKGRFSGDEINLAVALKSPGVYSYEPDVHDVYQKLLPMLLTSLAYHSGLESKASEFSARMIAMKNATDKASELGQALTRKYNKIRQSSITREVSEIIGGMEALGS